MNYDTCKLPLVTVLRHRPSPSNGLLRLDFSTAVYCRGARIMWRTPPVVLRSIELLRLRLKEPLVLLSAGELSCW
jgi:hypothetical protein